MDVGVKFDSFLADSSDGGAVEFIIGVGVNVLGIFLTLSYQGDDP